MAVIEYDSYKQKLLAMDETFENLFKALEIEQARQELNRLDSSLIRCLISSFLLPFTFSVVSGSIGIIGRSVVLNSFRSQSTASTSSEKHMSTVLSTISVIIL